MPVTIQNVYIQTFEQNVRQLAQQSQAKLRPYVTEKGTSGQKHNWERMAAGAATKKTAALTPTPVAQLGWSRRVSVAETWHAGEAFEHEDPVQMLVDPKSSIVENLSMAMNRAFDDLIITAATAAALNGDGSTTAFPGTQRVGDGTAAISFALVTQVQQKFMEKDIDPTIPKVAVVGPVQVRQLMALTQQTSSDYVNAQALQTLNASGIVVNWMGFTWVVSNRLLVPAAGQLDCLFFTKRAIGLQVNADISSRVAEDPSVSFAWRVYTKFTMGAVRVEDEQIVNLRVLNS